MAKSQSHVNGEAVMVRLLRDATLSEAKIEVFLDSGEIIKI